MARVPASSAITTKDSIASLWALADAEGYLVFFPKTQKDCLNFRNRLYAHRARERRFARQFTGTDVCPLDRFTFQYGHLSDYHDPIPEGVHPNGYYFIITTKDELTVTVARPGHPAPPSPVDDLVVVADPRRKKA